MFRSLAPECKGCQGHFVKGVTGMVWEQRYDSERNYPTLANRGPGWGTRNRRAFWKAILRGRTVASGAEARAFSGSEWRG